MLFRKEILHTDENEAPSFVRGPEIFIWHYVKSWAANFIALLLLVSSAAACSVGVQYVMKILVDAMAGPRNGTDAWWALGFFIGLIAAESVLWRLSGWLGCRTTVGVGVSIRLDLFHYLSGQSIRYFADNLAGSLGHRITSVAGHFGGLTNTVAWRILPIYVDFIGALIVFWTVDWKMMVALAFAVILIMAGLIVFGERGRPLHRDFAAKANEVAGDLVDVISNMWSVKAFSARRREWLRLKTKFEAEARIQKKSWMYTEKARVIHDIALWIMAGAMLVWALMLWSRSEISPGEVVVVSALTFRILHGSRDMAMSLVDMVQQFGFIADTLAVIGQRQTVVDHPGAPVVTATKGALSLENVSFSYRSGTHALNDISLEIPAGQKVGIVGPSGAGKSTFVHLLQRLYDLEAGQILIDGHAIDEITQDSLRRSLAVVPQEISLFHRSVMDNIRFGRPEASDEDVYAAARAAHCDTFIRFLSDGYDTLVGERGVKLSGGQRQRIGIARAFLKEAPIIVLDEATSALDSESELAIQRSLVEIMRDKTVLAVAHRLSTVASFDRIIVIDNGRIIEDGSPRELRERGGAFERMWRLQSEGLALEDAS
ncbi:ATP-binding cassette subfamily B protein [Neorhizobium sp. 2083]|uniref:ABC transporter ATP-binding protein n=1 Tax=Neorhizobium sp. 2083 TaxID=2817762 RepID=UPI0028648353|nr:ABC transporter ATP-binding protein [Neorhizobium sp. 2083]MDR6821064.1 ATP-binding cassette subfamily B protein [Neorhizobium sp. 2083]